MNTPSFEEMLAMMVAMTAKVADISAPDRGDDVGSPFIKGLPTSPSHPLNPTHKTSHP
jgi:hypothetical protein